MKIEDIKQILEDEGFIVNSKLRNNNEIVLQKDNIQIEITDLKKDTLDDVRRDAIDFLVGYGFDIFENDDLGTITFEDDRFNEYDFDLNDCEGIIKLAKEYGFEDKIL